jgi:hypothetical protein
MFTLDVTSKLSDRWSGASSYLCGHPQGRVGDRSDCPLGTLDEQKHSL